MKTISRRSLTRITALTLAGVLMSAAAARAATIKVVTSGAFTAAYLELVPEFESATHNQLVTEFGPSMGTTHNAIPIRLERGEAIDVVIMAGPALANLIERGKVKADSRVDLVQSRIGMAVKAGAPKPDISTTAAFRQALLDAKSIGFVGAGATAPYIRSLFDRLGIADEVKSKLKILPATNPAANAVANGEAELGITQISEILPYAGAQLVGPLPPEIQLYTVYPAAVAAGAKEPAAANALIKYLATPAAIAVLKAKGLSPG